MLNDDRGKIQYPDRAKQLRDFSGMKFGTITPTDIDGLIEYHNLGYVWIETKYKDSEVPFGQDLALCRVCDDLQKIKPTLLIYAIHDIEDVNDAIPVHDTIIIKYRYKGNWHPGNNMKTRKLVDRFFGAIEHEYLLINGTTDYVVVST